MKPKEVESKIEALGWYFERQSGGHRIFKHPSMPGQICISVGHPGKDLNPGLVKWLLSMAKKGMKVFR